MAGDEASIDELSVRSVSLMKLLSKDAKSASKPVLREEPLDEGDFFRDEISGALYAWTLVVEMSSVGKEIISRRMLPAAYLTVLLRLGVPSWSSRLMRLVNARARDILLMNVDVRSQRQDQIPGFKECQAQSDASKQIPTDACGVCSRSVRFVLWYERLG